MDLPNCSVVLSRITDEEIRRLCSPSGNNKADKGVRVKSRVKSRKKTHCGIKPKKITPGKQVAAKTKAINELKFFKIKKKSFKNDETGSFQSDSSLCLLPVKIKSKIEGRKKSVKRRQKFKKILQTSDSSVNNKEAAVYNACSNNFKNDVSSTLQNYNRSSKCDLHHQAGSSAISVNPSKEKQNNNPSQSNSISYNPELHYSSSELEDVSLSILINTHGLKVKNTKTLLNCNKQSNDDKKAKLFRGKRKKLKMPESKKTCFADDNFEVSVTNAIEMQKLDGSVEKKGRVCRLRCSTLSTSNSRKTTSKETVCTFCCHLKTDSLPSSDCKSDIEKKPREGKTVKRRKDKESRVPKVLKTSEARVYLVQKMRKTSPKVNKVGRKPGRVKRREINMDNSNIKITNKATKTLIKLNKPTKKSKRQKSQKSKNEIGPLKQNQNSQTSWHLIVNKMVNDNQTIQTLDKTTSLDIGKDINFVNATNTQKNIYSSRPTSSKYVKNLNISVTQSNLNTVFPQKNVLLDKLKYTKIAECNASFISDQSNFAVHSQRRNELVGIKSEQIERFSEKTADKLFDILTFQDSPEKYLRDEYPTSHRPQMSVSDNIYEIYGTKKTPGSTVTKDIYSFSSNFPHEMSNVYANSFNTREYFQDKNPLQKDLKKFTLLPQCDNKTDLNNVVSEVENVINVSSTEPTKISPLLTFSALPQDKFDATGVPVNKKTNKILFYKNNSPNFKFVNSSILYTTSEEYFSAEKAIYSKKSKISNFIFVDSAKPQDMEIKISNVSRFKLFENKEEHPAEFNKMVPFRLDININDLNSKTGETILSMPVEKDSHMLSNTENKPVSEMHSDILDDHFSNDLLNHEYKTWENISVGVDSLDVITILAVTDLGKNPQLSLNIMITVTKARLEELSSEKDERSQMKDEISYTRYNLHVLNVAQQCLSLYGSFSKVSEIFLKKS